MARRPAVFVVISQNILAAILQNVNLEICTMQWATACIGYQWCSQNSGKGGTSMLSAEKVLMSKNVLVSLSQHFGLSFIFILHNLPPSTQQFCTNNPQPVPAQIRGPGPLWQSQCRLSWLVAQWKPLWNLSTFGVISYMDWVVRNIFVVLSCLQHKIVYSNWCALWTLWLEHQHYCNI